eukprot:8050442-Pyramimonas_sp.AAC.1
MGCWRSRPAGGPGARHPSTSRRATPTSGGASPHDSREVHEARQQGERHDRGCGAQSGVTHPHVRGRHRGEVQDQ